MLKSIYYFLKKISRNPFYQRLIFRFFITGFTVNDNMLVTGISLQCSTRKRMGQSFSVIEINGHNTSFQIFRFYLYPI